MSTEHFKVKAKIPLDNVNIGDRIETSDFVTVTPTGNFVQLEFVEGEEKEEKTQVKPGIWSIIETPQGLKLSSTNLTRDVVLDEFVNTQAITEKIDKFFSRVHIYKECGKDIAKRGALLYGSAGTGKSTAIRKIVEKYVGDGKTAAIFWSTDKINPGAVKDFVKGFEYVGGVDKLILVAEDIGGVEVDQVKLKSSASLLALLDNSEKAFTITTLILSTTNHPEILMGNLANRPGRFDIKIECKNPDAKQRASLLKFYLKDDATEELQEEIKQKKYADFSAAHINEIMIRSKIEDIPYVESMEQLLAEIDFYKKEFQKKNKLGIGIVEEPEY